MKRAGPSQDLAVGGGEFVIAVKRSRDDDPVNGIAVHVGQQAGLGSDPAGDGQFSEANLKQFFAPFIDIGDEIDLAILVQHPDFEKSHSRDHCGPGPKSALDLTTRSGTQTTIVLIMPKQDMRIKEFHGRLTKPESDSSNHSAGIGETMSPVMVNSPFPEPAGRPGQ